MTLNIQNILKCVYFDTMSKETNNSGKEDHHSEKLLNDSSDEELQDKTLKTTEEEHRGTIPGSTSATASALVGARAQANPTVCQCSPKQKTKPNKLT